MLFSYVFAATQPRIVSASLPNVCTPPRGSHSRRNTFRFNTYEISRKCCKQRTYRIAKFFRINTYKKQGGGGCCASDEGFFSRPAFRRSAHPTKDAHPERPSGAEGFLSRPALHSLFAQRAFHNSLGIKRFQTLSRNCRVYN